MRYLSETKALQALKSVRNKLRSDVTVYECRAKSCMACDTPGACCVDEHFVNVHISKLEAVAITRSLKELPGGRLARVRERIDRAIEKYGLTPTGDTFVRTFACPLFEKGVGCLVHLGGKPVPCIVHACYDRREDLPPDELQTAAETKIGDLNERTYGRRLPVLPLPVALRQGGLFATAEDITHHKT
jgi:hypothetical protein